MRQLKNQKGITAIIVGIMTVVLISLAALAIDIGYALVTRNELQNIADGAALAATRQLGVFYETMSYEDQQSYVSAPGTIVPVAQGIAEMNRTARTGTGFTIQDVDVVIGTWNAETKTLTPTPNQPDAVRVIARRDGVANGPIATFFAKSFGTDTVAVSASATAALTGQSTAGPGGLPIPVGISKKWLEDRETYCNQPIKFYPTNSPEGCAGWNTYTDDPANASRLRSILDGLKDGTYQSPAMQVGEQFVFIGGTVASAFKEIKELFESMRTRNDGTFDRDEDSNTWTTIVVVYDYPDCANPQGEITIVGFVTVTITEILGSPEKTINAIVKCNHTKTGRGGGAAYGTKGSIPGLVE